MTATSAGPETEFADLPAGTAVQRRWFTASVGGHIGAVIWGSGTPAYVVVPDTGVSARDLDDLGAALDEPVVLIDRLGTGRSSGPAPSTPAREGRPLAEAAWSFASKTGTLVGLGAGGSAAALAAGKRTRSATRIVLVGADRPDDTAALDERGITVTALPDVDANSAADVAAALDNDTTATETGGATA